MDTFRKWIKTMRDAGAPKKQTIDRYEDVGDNVLKFLITRKKQNELLENFDVDLLKQFKSYLIKQHYADATIRKSQSVIKDMLTWAKSEKLLTSNPLDGHRIKHEKTKPHVFLSVAQFELLRSHQFSNDKLQQTADIFILYCRTGFHDQDLKNMAAQGETVIYKVAGYDFIKWSRIKTEEMAKVPASAWPEIYQIITKYGGWHKLPFISGQKMNDYLKLMAMELNVEISKMPLSYRQQINLEPISLKLSVKAGRKTLADWLLNELNWSRSAVKVVLGLKSDRSLDSYVREDERRVAHELRKLQQA